MYECDLCKKKFTKTSNLYHHKRNTHKIIVKVSRGPGKVGKNISKTVNTPSKEHEDSFLKMKPNEKDTKGPEVSVMLVERDYKPINLIENSMSVLLQERKVQPKESKDEVCIETDFETEKNEMLAHFFLFAVFIIFVCDQQDRQLESTDTHELADSQNESQNVLNVELFFETDDIETHNKKKGKQNKNSKKVPCTVCAKMLHPEKYNLKRHIQQAHEREKLFCDKCEYSAKHKVYLDKHIIREHSGRLKKVWSKIHWCSQCDYSSKFSNNLKKHMMKHTGEKPHQCSYCDYACASASTLRLHSRSHTKEKPFSCNECGKKFGFKQQVEVHMMIHTGEKPYKCMYCTYATYAKTSLIRHTRTHTKEKPLQCSLCGKKFAQNHHLRGHLKSMHKSKINC